MQRKARALEDVMSFRYDQRSILLFSPKAEFTLTSLHPVGV